MFYTLVAHKLHTSPLNKMQRLRGCSERPKNSFVLWNVLCFSPSAEWSWTTRPVLLTPAIRQQSTLLLGSFLETKMFRRAWPFTAIDTASILSEKQITYGIAVSLLQSQDKEPITTHCCFMLPAFSSHFWALAPSSWPGLAFLLLFCEPGHFLPLLPFVKTVRQGVHILLRSWIYCIFQ